MLGRMESYDIPRKAVCERARISESMLSRVVNGERALQETDIFEMGFALGSLADARGLIRKPC
jgi:hypothetical protein